MELDVPDNMYTATDLYSLLMDAEEMEMHPDFLKKRHADLDGVLRLLSDAYITKVNKRSFSTGCLDISYDELKLSVKKLYELYVQLTPAFNQDQSVIYTFRYHSSSDGTGLYPNGLVVNGLELLPEGIRQEESELNLVDCNQLFLDTESAIRNALVQKSSWANLFISCAELVRGHFHNQWMSNPIMSEP